jgi:hypothetical protein
LVSRVPVFRAATGPGACRAGSEQPAASGHPVAPALWPPLPVLSWVPAGAEGVSLVSLGLCIPVVASSDAHR